MEMKFLAPDRIKRKIGIPKLQRTVAFRVGDQQETYRQ